MFTILLILLVYISGTYLYNAKINSVKNIRAVIVQGNIDQYVKWDKKYQEDTLKKYMILTNKALDKYSGENTLVVWPETAMHFIFKKEIFSLIVY